MTETGSPPLAPAQPGPARAATTPRAPVLADVAAAAGVSSMTVSRVLNDSARVSDRTRARVQQAAHALGYHANAAARSLATGRSGVLGVVSSASTQYGPTSVLHSVASAALAAGAFTNLLGLPEIDETSMRRALEHLLGLNVDGVVLLVPHRAAVTALRACLPDRPHVVVGGGHPAASSVHIDQALGARLAVGHLLGLGHRTVHHVGGPTTWYDADTRRAGWAARLQDAGAPVPPPLVGDWTAASGYAAGQQLARDPSVTAVFAANDQMALGVLLALREAGRDVPGEVSVVGFDDTPDAGFFTPPLTTVHQDFAQVGRRAVELLLGVVAGERTAGHEVVAPELVVRDSAGPAPRR